MASGAKGTSESSPLRAALRRAVKRADRQLPGPRVMLTREASRQLDATCAGEFGIPSIVLMEHASMGIASILRQVCAKSPTGVLILAGPGNNGGDGLACARHLNNAGLDLVSVALVANRSRLTGDAATNLTMAERLGVRLVACGLQAAATIRREAGRFRGRLVVVDALLGTGLTRPVSGAVLEAIRECNELRRSGRAVAVLSVDVPSGLDADTGHPPTEGEAVRADATVTMAGLKPGLVGFGARRWAGTVGVVEIGAPPKLLLRQGKADRQRREVGQSPSPRRESRG